MSTAPVPGQYPVFNPNPASITNPDSNPNPIGQLRFPTSPRPDDLNLAGTGSTGLGVRRRASIQQGRALELLGHSVEYLVDSRMFMIDQPSTRADAEAVQILMRLSREVFSDCTEVASPARRLRLWINSRLRTPANC
jgi:hypothetical protein